MTIEPRLRTVVASASDMDVQDVYVEPLLAEQPSTLFAVVDIPRAAPASTNSPLSDRTDDAGQRTVSARWEGTAQVRWQGPGAGAAARRFVLAVLANVVDDRALGVLLELRGVGVVAGEIERGDTLVSVASVQFGVQWTETLTVPVGLVERVRLGLAHEEAHVVEEEAGTPVPV